MGILISELLSGIYLLSVVPGIGFRWCKFLICVVLYFDFIIFIILNPLFSITGFNRFNMLVYCHHTFVSCIANRNIGNLISQYFAQLYFGVAVFELTRICSFPMRCNPLHSARSEMCRQIGSRHLASLRLF
jgi:hypothetical protein